MSDDKYCYPDSDVLKNKLGLQDEKELLEVEKELTVIRLGELQEKPLKGKFDFKHLKAIHKYIFQDIYDWAGKERTVEIGKGNLFCTVACIQEFAGSIFEKYFAECFKAKDNFEEFVRVLADNYGDLNALHPFREGNGRAQREFARLICLECGYDFDLSHTSHREMLAASKLSFDKADSSGFIQIFSKGLCPLDGEKRLSFHHLKVLTGDDLTVGATGGYDYYENGEHEEADIYNEMYRAKIDKMDAERRIREAKETLKYYKSGAAEPGREIRRERQVEEQIGISR